MKRHRFLGEAENGRFCIKGINLFKYKWDNAGQVVIVMDHKTDKPKSVSEYKIKVGNSEIKFLALQDTNGVWSFYDSDE